MIIVNVTYTMKEGVRAADFLHELENTGLAPYCRTERGNHAYQYHCADDRHLYLLEKWDDEECLAAHMATENFARISRLTEQYAADMDLRKVDTAV